MAARSHHQSHDKYKTRIESYIKGCIADKESLPQTQAHNAKYLAVLISGYLEQAIKELLLDYVSNHARDSPQITKYIRETWPISKNMNAQNIEVILRQFNAVWAEKFTDWLEEQEKRKADINSIVDWRNRIAHGQESNTNNVTLTAVKDKFTTVKALINFLEKDLLTEEI